MGVSEKLHNFNFGVVYPFKAIYTSNKVHFHSSFGGKKKFEKAERRYTVFKHSNTPALLEAGCRLM